VSNTPWSAIVVAAVPYDGSLPLGCWQLARILGTRRPVLFVEPPHSLLSGRPEGPALRAAADGSMVHVLTPVAPPAYNRPTVAPFADRAISRQVRRAADRVFGGGPRALLVCTPRRGYLDVSDDVLLYWQRDAVELMARSGGARRLDRQHRRLIRHADIVTGVSPELVDEGSIGRDDAVLVPNGCDFDHFSTPQPRPEQLPTGRPVIGFAGGVSDRLDVDLLLALADERPQWLFAVVGEIVRDVPERANLLLTGRRPYEELPAWLQAFDVGIVPYVEDLKNRHSHPLKALEYLAAGTPTVSVPIAALEPLGNVVHMASGRDAFLAALDDVLANPDAAAECQAVAKANSWSARVSVLESLVEAAIPTARRHRSRRESSK
jgi:glycosyltransferase involved in cell wall biosynthesis